MARHLVGDVVTGAMQGALEGIASAGGLDGKRPSGPPTRPTVVEFLGFTSGIVIILASCAGFALHLYQSKQEANVLTHPAARAEIISSDRKRTGGSRFTEALIDYERQTPAGPVACRNAPARFRTWSQDFEAGKTVEVHPQSDSCYRPIYAPDIGNSRTTLLVSLIALPIGLAFVGVGYGLLRQRRSELQQAVSLAEQATGSPPG